MSGESGDAINRREHTRELKSAMSFQSLAEHVTWELDRAVGGHEYPLEVRVTVEVEEVGDDE